MRLILFALLFFTLFISSCEFKKSYKYFELSESEGLLGGNSLKEKEAELIKATNDSSAYLEAFEKFCISLKVNKDMQSSMGKTYSTPKAFKLYDDQNNEITNILFANKDLKEKEIQEQVFSLKNSIQESLDKIKAKENDSFGKKVIVDSIKIKQLVKFFRIKKDEFSNDNKKWFKPKTAPIYTNANGLYCYFQTENDVPSNLRFRLQYYSDDWLFFSRVQFSIDGKAYEYIPIKTETDSGDGGYIWEWFDESITQSDRQLINALANAKSAKIKLIGQKYYDTKNISQSQIVAIKQTLELYIAMGGQY